MNRVQRNVFKAAAVAGIVLVLLFAAGCSGDLLGYIQELVARAEYNGIIELPRTGQTTMNETGDDGDLKMGVAWPDPRFTDHGNGTITDNLTGLIWLKDGNRFGQRTWSVALSDCNGLADNGTNLTDGSSAGDWRLPNVNELKSLINAGAAYPDIWLNSQGFSGVQADNYWSSTTYAIDTPYAWYVYMLMGIVSNAIKTDSHYVLAVRSGQAGGTVSLPRTGQITMGAAGDDGHLEKGVAWPVPRFTVGAETGCITDNLTGLMWDQSGDTAGETKTWAEALSDCNGLSLGGHSDWRLPNVNELESLMHAGQEYPADWLNGQGFIGVQFSGYWSSTTYAANPTGAWYVIMGIGSVFNLSKADNCYVLAVRGGQ